VVSPIVTNRFNQPQIVMKVKPAPPEVQAWLKSEGHKGASAHRDRLGAVSRAYKDRPLLIPAPDEKGLIYELMGKPTPMLKFGRSGAPHWRNFQVCVSKSGSALRLALVCPCLRCSFDLKS
jgi:hypothetical protein